MHGWDLRLVLTSALAALAALVALVAAGAVAPLAFGQAPAKIDFRTDVAPLLQQQCLDCHGPDMQMAELRLDQRRFVLGDEADPDLVKPGHSGESLLIKRLTDPKLGILMPPSFPFPPGEKVGLSEASIQILNTWIDQGAPWPDGVVLAGEAAKAVESREAQALRSAIRGARHAAAAELLKQHPELAHARDGRGETPLMHAAFFGDLRLVELLLDHSADVNLASHSGATALLLAAGEFEKAQLLVSRGAKVDAKSNLGRTPLLVAASVPGNLKTVRLLLERGGQVNVQDKMGDTCLTMACKRGDAALAKALIEAGANVTAGGAWPVAAPLACAAEEGNVEIIAGLLEHGAGRQQDHLDLALASATMRGSLAAVRLLIEHGANPNTPSPLAGYTPLMLAVYCEDCDPETVRLLLAKGADVHAKGATGETPLSLAKKHGRSVMVEMLEKAGAGE